MRLDLRRKSISNISILFSLFFVLTNCAENTSAPGDSFYETEIQPIFIANCVSCHNSGAAQSGINMSSYSTVMSSTGTVLGKLVTASDLQSPLIQVIEGTASGVSKMPLGGSLNASDIQKIKDWVSQGAKNE